MGKGTITIYQKPTCSTCREAVKLVQQSGHEFVSINYYEKPFAKAKLKELLNKAGLKPREVLRTKEEIYRKLGLAKKSFNDDQILDLLVKHPDLIQRPLIERDDRAMLARPAKTVKKLLK